MKLSIHTHGLITLLIIVYFASNISTVLPFSVGSASFVASENITPKSKTYTSLDSSDVTAQKSSHILIGQVESMESRWNPRNDTINTYVKIRVEENLKGDTHDQYVVVKHKGGEIGNIGQRISDEPSFQLGEKVKLFLKLNQQGEFTVVDGLKGKITLAAPASAGYGYSGFHWDSADLPVPYYINRDGTPDVPGTTSEFQAVEDSFQTWEDDAQSIMNYTFLSSTTISGDSPDGYNVVSWQSIDGVGGTLAHTVYWYNLPGQLLTEFDIVFDEDETWSTTGESGKHSIQNVGTHEVGHTLVLDDLYDLGDSEQTMYGYSAMGETKKQTLEAGDLAGIRYIYPLSNPTYTIATSPSGLQIEVDGTAYTSPQSFEWAPSSVHTVYVPSPQNGSFGTRYLFTDWSDDGAQQHQVTMGTSSLTIVANYVTQHLATIETTGLELPYPASINYTQLGISNNAFTSASWSGWCDSGSTLTIDAYVLGADGQRWITYNTSSWAVNSPLTATVSYVAQYRVSMVFETFDQALTIQPTQIQLLGGTPNNTMVRLESFSDVWLDNVAWTVKQVIWQSSNVANPDTPLLYPSPNNEWTVKCRVYPVSFESAFKNFAGDALSENPTFFTLQFPNGTVSGELNPISVYYIQNGTTLWQSINWKEVEVAPSHVSFDAANGNPVVNCLVYDFLVKVTDTLGFPVAGAEVSAEFSNGVTANAQTGADGIAVVRMAPPGRFIISVSYLLQTMTLSGDAARAASVPVEAKMAFGLSVLVLLAVVLMFVGVLVAYLWLRVAGNK